MQQTDQAVWLRIRRTRPTGRSVAAAVLAACALSSAACAIGDDAVDRDALTTADTLRPDLPVRPGERAGDLPAPPDAASASGELTVTREQRVFLDELAAAGVATTSELRALTIGSSVCQARAAKQSEQAVWDFIVPLVRSDVRAVRPPSVAITRGEVDTVTADYIRIATERLC